MSSASFSPCRTEVCGESALSFSDHCWEHVEQGAYVKDLRRRLKELAPDPSTVLNLKKVSADGLDFSQKNLSGSNLDQAYFTHSSFVGSVLEGVNLIGARLSACDFVGANLSGANLTRASLAGCSFAFSDLRRAYLVEASFKDADMLGAVLFEARIWNSDLSGAKHLKKKNFQDPGHAARESQTHLSSDDPTISFESYRQLKHYFYRNGLNEDASWAAYRERVMERKHFFKSRDARYFPSLLMDLLSGYTEKPNRVILSSMAIILLFACLYYGMDAARAMAPLAAEKMTFWNSLYFSLITFTTVGYGDFVPRPEIWYKIPACVEAFSGPFMAGLYIFTLTRRYAAG